MAAVPRAVKAQITSHLVLVAPPVPTNPVDTALSFELAEKLRKEIRAWGERRVVTSREMCQMLRASNYSCQAIMSDEDVEHLADALHTDAFITGLIARDNDLVLELRITARNRSSFAGSLRLVTDTDVDADSIATLARQGLDAFWLAANFARRCYEARDEGEYSDAESLARGALSIVPNQSAAALCLATVYELTNESIPKRIQAYGHAFRSDPRIDLALRRLVGLYFEYGDTLSGNVLLTEQLRREPSNHAIRLQLAQNWISLSLADSAFTVLYSDADKNDDNLQLLRFIAHTCLEEEHWPCQLEALARQYAIDSSLASDTAFYYRIVGSAQEAGNDRGVLRWTKTGIERADQPSAGFVKSMWLAHAAALVRVGNLDSAVAVYLEVGRRDTTNAQPLLAAADLLVNPPLAAADSAAPVDTLALQRGDSVLTVVALRHARSDSVLQRVSNIYFTRAAALVQQRQSPRLAAELLDQAMEYDVGGQTRATANALKGLALASVVQQLDAAIRNDGVCDMVDEIADTIARAREATVNGRAAMPSVADQVLPLLDEYTILVPQYRAVLQCGA